MFMSVGGEGIGGSCPMLTSNNRVLHVDKYCPLLVQTEFRPLAKPYIDIIMLSHAGGIQTGTDIA